MVMPTELDSPAALPLQSGTAFTAPYIVVGVRMPESNIELNSDTTTNPNDSPCHKMRPAVQSETSSIPIAAVCCHRGLPNAESRLNRNDPST